MPPNAHPVDPDRRFALAPMSGLIRGITLGLWALPLIFLAVAGVGGGALPGRVGVALLALYAGVWLYSRPTEFVVGDAGVTLRWPLRRRTIPWSQIAGARPAPPGRALRGEIGWSLRIGVGGLWGGFGWMWNPRLGLCPLYVSRTRDLVWLERRGTTPMLLSPERPTQFVTAIQDGLSHESIACPPADPER